MGRIYDAMRDWFDDAEWRVEEHPEQGIIATAVEGEHGSWRCFARANEESELFVFYAVAEVGAPEDRRQAVAEFLTRANYGLLIGNFELDVDDGEVRYKSSVDLEGSPIVAPLIRQCVHSCLMTADRYLPGLRAVAEGGAEPAEAVAAVESGEDGGDDDPTAD